MARGEACVMAQSSVRLMDADLCNSYIKLNKYYQG